MDLSRLCIYSDIGKVLFDYVTAQMAAARDIVRRLRIDIPRLSLGYTEEL
jgi:hypothetical protein